MDNGTVLAQLSALNERLRASLGLEADPITASSTGTWRADGIAGLLRLNPNVELEVVPKFLEADGSWREDFFLLAVLVRTGRLLINESINATVAGRADLATLIARTLLSLHWENHRRPLRGYKRTHTVDFSLDGEVDLDSLALPDADGFHLERLVLTSTNAYNAVLKAAVVVLAPEVNDGDTRVQLQRLARQLGPQPTPPRMPPALPARHQHWQPAYELSGLVLQGLGLNLASGEFTGPGFVLSTWSAWQILCEELVRRAFPAHRTEAQHPFTLGHRRGGNVVTVRPDIAILGDSDPVLLLDAKYKTRQGRQPAISSSDVYESLAFMRASHCGRMLLLYPALEPVTVLPLGGSQCFDEVKIGTDRIDGHLLQVRGLSDKGGFGQLVSGMRTFISPFVTRPHEGP